jgi:hypothetical protein
VIQFEEIDPVLSLHGLDDAQRHERSETCPFGGHYAQA